MSLEIIILIGIVALAVGLQAARFLYKLVPGRPTDELPWYISDYASMAVNAAKKLVGVQDDAAIARYAAEAIKQKYPKLKDLDIEVVANDALQRMSARDESLN